MHDIKESKSRVDHFLKNPRKSLWTLAIPIMFGIGIQTFYNLIDLLFIGQIGGDAIAGVGFNMPILIGGATTSKAHTAIKIAPSYSDGVVVHVPDET